MPVPTELVLKAKNVVENRQDETLALLGALIADQKTGGGNVQSRLAGRFAESGCRVETIRYRPEDVSLVDEFAHPSLLPDHEQTAVVARLGNPDAQTRILVFAHPDAETVNAPESWSRDPFTLDIRDGRMHGWGIADDLAGVAAMAALPAVLEAIALPSDVEVIFASAPSKALARGTAALLCDHGVDADVAVYLHPAESGAGLGEIKGLSSGHVEFSVTVAGRQPPTTEPLQTALAHLGIDPLEKAQSLIAALRRMDRERAERIRHPVLEQAVQRSTNLMISHMAMGRPKALARYPQGAIFSAALSFPPGETLASVCAEIETTIKAAAEGDEWLAVHAPELTFLTGVSPSEVDPDAPLFSGLADCVASVTGERPALNALHTGSDIRNPFVQKAIPAVGFGALCGNLTQNGFSDEWVDRSEFLDMIAATALFIATWAGASATRT
ncbi:M20/M25/M40 family metallo-hydrolase [Martelella lutilitoris]|uniref:M20/M25/M40 family metallo-hydrolase n=1 Tax=Martelella lutilitoris TaxID=2583532 RepID=A0A5C4JUB4_9HYPH|nr:M20/M25/M40 family metallo-hydrolase [Martelella lutilitoris]TNB49023.1 M20/M25/M40 family metallo-hydrolase [Martelella lutilitoris]